MSNIFFSTKTHCRQSHLCAMSCLFWWFLHWGICSSSCILVFFLINGWSLVYLILLYTAVFVSLLFLRYAPCFTNESNPVLFLAFSILTSSLFSFFYTPLLMNSEEIAYIHSPVKASRHSIHTHTPIAQVCRSYFHSVPLVAVVWGLHLF